MNNNDKNQLNAKSQNDNEPWIQIAACATGTTRFKCTLSKCIGMHSKTLYVWLMVIRMNNWCVNCHLLIWRSFRASCIAYLDSSCRHATPCAILITTIRIILISAVYNSYVVVNVVIIRICTIILLLLIDPLLFVERNIRCHCRLLPAEWVFGHTNFARRQQLSAIKTVFTI